MRGRCFIDPTLWANAYGVDAKTVAEFRTSFGFDRSVRYFLLCIQMTSTTSRRFLA